MGDLQLGFLGEEISADERHLVQSSLQITNTNVQCRVLRARVAAQISELAHTCAGLRCVTGHGLGLDCGRSGGVGLRVQAQIVKLYSAFT